MGVDAKLGHFPKLSQNVPFCPRLSSFVPIWGPELGQVGKRGQNGTFRDNLGKRPNFASTPI